ncbi:MAG: VWA domain-containing protein [Akkermansiaceae bacterium]
MLSFLYIWVFVIAPLPFLVWRFLPPKSPRNISVRVPFGRRIEQAISTTPLADDKGGSRVAKIIPSMIWVLILIAIARPQWIEDPIEKEVPTRDLLLLVDLSGSMDQDDFTNSKGQKVNRLEAVKEILGDFLEKREGDRVGLVVFGDAPFLQSPFSTDLELSRQLLEETEVGMAGPRTALGDAIGLGINLFEQSELPAKTIIALTDGNDTKSQVPPVEAARVAEDKEIKIHTVAIGDPTTVGEDKLDLKTLDQVAERTGGKSFFAADREELAGIYDELDRIETRKVEKLSHRPRSDVFHLPLLLALVVSVGSRVSFRRLDKSDESADRPLRVNPVTGELELNQNSSK